MLEPALRGAPWWVDPAAAVIQRLPAGRYRLMNWIAGGARAPFWARLPADAGSLQFRCDLRDGIMREVCLTGGYEPQETALLRQTLGPGMTFVDVGANWGYFTLVAAHLVGAAGRVLSVEADPRACAALRGNLAQNALGWVSVCEAAASDGSATLTLQEYEKGASDSGNYGLTSTTTSVSGGRRFEVPARPLDEVLEGAGIDYVDFLKMDIEGGEGRALPGLCRALSERRIARLLLEVHPEHLRDQGSSAAEVTRILRRYGYRPWKIDHSPSVYRRVAAGRMDVTAALAPLADGDDLGTWPHLLWT